MNGRIFGLIAGLVLSLIAVAGDIKDGNAYVKAIDTDRFVIDRTPMGKNMLMAHLQELKDSQHITGIILRNGQKASGEHRHLVKVIGDYLQLASFSEDGSELKPLQGE